MVAPIRRRAQSFSHLPRQCLSREEFLEYLGEKTTVKHAGGPNPSPESADESGAAPEEAIVGWAKENGMAALLGDENSQVSPAIAVEETLLKDAVGQGDDGGGDIIPRRRIVRRWPSSADIGMYTDGR